MIYKYDKNKLLFIKDTKTIKLTLVTMAILSVFSFILGRYA